MKTHVGPSALRGARVAALVGLLTALLGGLALARGLPAAAQSGAAPAAANRQLFLPLLGNGEATLEAEAERNLGFSVALSPAPQVLPGDLLRATVTARNAGAEALSNSVVTLRYMHSYLAYERAEGERTLMIGQGGDTVQVLFRTLGPGETVTGTVIFRVRDSVANGTSITVTPEYFCEAGLCKGNQAQVQVSATTLGLAGADASGDLLVAPASGGLDTVFRFSSNRYNRLDVIKLWLSRLDGSSSARLPQEYHVGDDGWVRFELKGSELGQGAWRVLAYATVSNAITTANVTVGAAPAAAPEGLAPAAPEGLAPATPGSFVPQAGGAGGIAGQVTDALSGAGVPDVLVVVSQGGVAVASARSRADGAYLIPTGLASGAYAVRALAASAGGALAYQDAEQPAVTVTEPELASANFALSRGGTIAGRVTAGDTRRALAGVAVEVLAGATVVGSGVTGDDGAYQVEGLAAGTYTVSFITATGDDGAVAGYADGAAADVALAAGATLYVDETLALRADTATIRGRVSGPGGGLAEVLVAVLDADGDLADLTLSASDGTYATGDLPNGVYRLAFLTFLSENATTRRHVGAYLGGATYAAATTVTIAAPGALPGRDVALALGGAVSGTVRGVAGAALGDVLVAAFDGASRVAAVTHTDGAGAYRLDGLAAGGYRVGYFPRYAEDEAVRRYLGAFHNGKASLEVADAVAVTAGQTVSAIDATLVQGGLITGTVKADGGAGLEGVVVVVFNGGGGIATVALSDEKGSYTTGGLAPRAYSVLFDTIFAPVEASRGYLDEYFDDRRAAPYTTVNVAAGASATASASLGRGGQIAGRVTAADSGLGLGGVAVLVSSGGALVSITMTDASGAYSTAGLPAGSYSVQFDPSLAAEQGVRGYQGASLAAPVTVAVGAVTPGANVALVPAP